MKLGRLGVWSWLDSFDRAQTADLAGRVEQLGYAALWVPEAVGRDPFTLLGYLAGQTTSLCLATGIANIYARDPMAMNASRKTLADLSGGRFILGLGVSHAHLVDGVRGHDYSKPLSTMRNYLDRMESSLYLAHEPEDPGIVMLAALRPRMLKLAAERTQGAHPYLVTPEHTARAREILGEGILLAPEQMLLRERDPSKARAAARVALKPYVSAPNYQNSLKEFDFTDEDFQDGGSNRLIDALVAWGDETTIAKRIQEHFDAGADHVAIQALPPDGSPGIDMPLIEALAPRVIH